MTQFTREQYQRWARQLEAIDVVLSVNSQLNIRYCEGLTDLFTPKPLYKKTVQLLLDYYWHQAHEELEHIAAHAYEQEDREIAVAAADQVRHTYNHFADLLHAGRAAEAALFHGMLDAYLVIKS